jgi:DNA-binding SARP family transcriptional activator
LDRVLQYDPCDEEAVLRIVNIKLQKGDHSSALKTYRKFEKTLWEELGILPSGQFPSEVTGQG